MKKIKHENYSLMACALVRLDPSEANIQGFVKYFKDKSIEFDEAKFRDCIKDHMAIECAKEYLGAN